MVKSIGAKRFGVISLVLLALALTMQSSSAGLGLGEARVDSFLGQTLNVRIALLDPSQDALDSLSVEIASVDDHARLGVPSTALALGLRVELDRTVNPPLLRVRSTRPVSEPFLQLLIDARWASGRMLREYTLFLDPPTVPVAPPIRRLDQPETPLEAVAEAPEPPAAAAPAAAVSTPTEPRKDREPAREPARATAQPAPTSRVGPVRSGQTLWSIAEAWRPDQSLSMNQIMLAILENNPQAFTDGNVNRLLRGAELVMPDPDAVRAIDPDDAGRRIRAQNAAWQAAQRPAAVSTAAPRPAVPPATVEPVSAPEPLVPPAPDESGSAVEAAVEAAAPSEDAVAVSPADDPGIDEALRSTPRLELSAADEDLLADSQAIGVERGRLEEQLDGLVQELRADGFEDDEVAASVDQIRQAIESDDAGGLMVASEGLASLQQQLRDMRLERERSALEAEAVVAASAPDPRPTASAAGDAPGWLWPLLAAAAVLLVLALAVVLLMRRRARRQDTLEAGQAQLDPSAGRKPALVAASSEASTDALDAKLADLYDLAEQEDREAFGSAFAGFHRDLQSTDDPRWREAVVLARALVPGHPLLVNRPESEKAEIGAGIDAEDRNRELMDLLDDSPEDFEDDELSLESEDAEDFAGLLDDQEADAENPDLARLANRLDAEDRPVDDAERLELPESETESLFAADEPLKPDWDREDPDEALELDFEFTSTVVEAGDGDASDASDAKADLAVPPQDPKVSEASRESGAPERVDDALSEDRDWFDLGVADEMTDAVPEREGLDEDDASSEVLSSDDAEVKLDLARAYLSMDDPDSARALLEEIMAEGSKLHREQALQLLDDLK